MTAKFWISAAVMFVLTFALSWGVHGGLLHTDYMTLTGMRKPEEARTMMGWMILAHAIFALGFTWVYLQGREDKPWLAQGIRYGIAVACLAIIPVYLIYHVVTPVPLGVAFKQIINADAGLTFDWGAIDFAGGTVVHINAGIAGLVGAIFDTVRVVLMGVALAWLNRGATSRHG